MKANLESFKYFLDKVQLKNWDELEKKIKNINSASAIEHARWMDTIVTKVNSMKK